MTTYIKQGQEFIIKDTHRGLWYEDGKITKVLEAGRYEFPTRKWWQERLPTVECVLVDIRAEVKEAAAGYGVAIRRADVKDLIFPGNLQEIMNRVLAAERNSQAQLVEARTKAEVEEIQAKTRAESKRRDAEAEAVARRLQLEAEAEAARLKAENETRALVERQQAAEALEKHPGLLRLAELEALRELAHNANARVYLGLGPDMLKIGDEEGKSR